MKHVLLFGATGNLGRAIARELIDRGFQLSVVVRDKSKLGSLLSGIAKVWVADVTKPNALDGIMEGQEMVISALGKSVSPMDRSKPGFEAVDLQGNLLILDKAKQAGVRKFVYVSAFHAEQYPHLVYFRVHHAFAEALIASGIDYSIIKPPAIFSAFREMIDLAKKGQLVSIGKGEKRTNPIYEGDLAAIVVDSLGAVNAVIEAGGEAIYTRRQLLDIVQQRVNPNKRVREVPLGLVRIALPVIRLLSRNAYDKFAFFITVMERDTLAPQVGRIRFETYVDRIIQETRSASSI